MLIHEKLASLLIAGMVLGFSSLVFMILLRRFFDRESFFPKLAAAITPVGFLVGEMMFRPVPLTGWLGLLVLCVSQLVSGRAVRILLLFIGGMLLASWSTRTQTWWLQFPLILAVLCLSSPAAAFQKRYAPFSFTLLLLLTTGAIFMVVPDTEDALLLFGMLLGMAVGATLTCGRRLDDIGSAALMGVLAWVICVGGRGRPASVIVSVGCLGYLVVDSLMRLLIRLRASSDKTGIIFVFIIHCFTIGIILVLARTTSSIPWAIFSTAAALVSAVLMLRWWGSTCSVEPLSDSR